MIRPTTIIDAPRLAAHLGQGLTLASETFQLTGSFKFRAAYHVASSVAPSLIITASSGNFGQAMAYACRLLGKSCIVVMPHNSMRVKVEAVREYGGRVDLIDTREISRAARVAELAAEYPEAFVARAYDDPLVIEGNSTLAAELAALDRALDVVVAPLGGGGLTAGLVLGAQRADAKFQVVGAEPLIANDAARSFRAGRIIANDSEPQTIADGVRTISLGEHNWESIGDAVRLLFTHANLKAEPTGALALAAVLTQPEMFRDRAVCCVVSGGNVDPELYGRIIAA